MIKKFFNLLVLSFSVLLTIYITSASVNKINSSDFYPSELLNTPYNVSDDVTKINSIDYSLDHDIVDKEISVQLINSFCSKVSSTYFDISDTNHNCFFSPLLLFYNLLMLERGTSGATYENLHNLLTDGKYTDEELDSFAYHRLKRINQKSCLTNSIWFRDGAEINNDYINAVTNNSYTNIYQSAFNDNTKQEMANWLNYYTGNLLQVDKNDFAIDDKDIVSISSLYFQNLFGNLFYKDESQFDTFNGDNNIEYIHGDTTTYYTETGRFNMLSLESLSFFSILYIFPTDNYLTKHRAEDMMTDDAFYELINFDMENRLKYKYYDKKCFPILSKGSVYSRKCDVELSIPKIIKSPSRISINPLLNSLGIDSIFDSENNCFSNMISRNKNRFGDIFQDIFFQIDSSRVKKDTSEIRHTGCTGYRTTPLEKINIVLNKTFAVVVKAGNTTAFIALINDPKALQ